MQKISIIFLLALMALACEGPIGPEGPPGQRGDRGPQGEPGITTFSAVFELFDVNFTAANDYSLVFEFPADELEVFESDVVLAYVLWETTGENNDIAVWRQLPQTVFFEEGILQYNFDHTFVDARIFLDGTIDPAVLEDAWTLDQIVRIVVIPAEIIAENGRYDFSDYDATIRLFGIDDSNVRRIGME